MINVVHINASDRNGGAARSCYRLHQSLRRQGVNSCLCVQQKRSPDPAIDLIASSAIDSESFQDVDLVQRVFAAHNRTDISNTHFSLPLAGSELVNHPAVEAADIVHLHWVAHMLTPADIHRLVASGKPVVWTLHDLRPLTGGCHFSAGCSKFQDACSGCPQLRRDPFDLPAAVLRDQIELIDAGNLTMVAPSRWIAEQARSSALLRGKARIELIPNGIDLDVFAPHPRADARAAFGLPLEGTYILCGADQTKEKRKGFEALARVLREVVHDPRFVRARARVLCVGEPPPGVACGDMPLVQLGRIQEEERMALAFAASDVFVLPSLEDNLPNMLLEALSCGTPAVAYAAGGIPEILQDGINGRLVPLADERGFGEALLDLVENAGARLEMGRRGRVLACEHHSSRLQAARHLELYRELIRARGHVARSRQIGQQAPHRHGGNSPGPAVGALLDPLTIHCLKEEMLELQRRVRTSDKICMAQAQRLENLQLQRESLQLQLEFRQEAIQDLQERWQRAEAICAAGARTIEQLHAQLESKEEVIRDVHDHWRRAEETCAARLGVIEQLDAHRQWLEMETRAKPHDTNGSKFLQGIATVKKSVRFDDWWYSKMPPLLAVAYLQILLLGVPLGRLAVLLPSLFFSLACVAAYGHVVNDIFDIVSDRRAGKPNAMERLKPWQRQLSCAVLVGLGFLPAVAGNYSAWGLLLLACNYLWPTLYSVPGIRLKERGILGVLCDVAGSHLTPTLLVLAVLSSRHSDASVNSIAFLVTALVWSVVLGVKGILNHQVADRENDEASGTVTFATGVAAERLERFLPRYNLLVELPVSAAFVFLVYPVCPAAAVAFSIYCVVEALKYRLGFQFALNADPRNTRASFPFVNDFFYYFWLPMAAAVQLALRGPAWAWLPLVQLGLFSRTGLFQLRDVLALGRASRSHMGHWFARFRLKR